MPEAACCKRLKEEMATYVLYQSRSAGSLTFLEGDQTGIIEPDAVEIWRVEAPSWEIACLKRNEFLGWGPYKPQISGPDDLMALLPRSKHDFDHCQLLINLGYPAVKPILPHLLEWIQDVNWPIARVILPFLISLGSTCRDEINAVLESNDGMWKYWVISALIDSMEAREAMVFVPVLRRLAISPTTDDQENEVDLAARAVLQKLGTT